MIIGVPKEIKLQEHRIGLTPDSVKLLTNKGHKVIIESNGGYEAGFANDNYIHAGAEYSYHLQTQLHNHHCSRL